MPETQTATAETTADAAQGEQSPQVTKKKATKKKKAKKPGRNRKADSLRWSFPSVVKCPRCGANDTRAYSYYLEKGRQYRHCIRGVCRHKFSVTGELV